jgi:hypothetical protein
MAGKGAAIVASAAVYALAVAGFASGAAGPEAVAQSAVPAVAIDVDIAGNSPRTVGSVQNCVSTSVGGRVTIDIVIPPPGIPAARGLLAYQYSLRYDPLLVWVVEDIRGQLLEQATGSIMIPLSDELPDRNGIYISWGVDFGPAGIEPAGSSEKGPGVLSRLVLEARREGRSELIVADVQLVDDNTQRIEIGSLKQAEIRIGEPCPGSQATATPTLAQAVAPTASPTPQLPPSPQSSSNPVPVASPASAVPELGGPPAGPQAGARSQQIIVAGLATAGVGLLLALTAVRPPRGT